MAAVRGFLQCLLKLFNFILALMGIGMVFYSILMLNEWHKTADAPSPAPSVGSFFQGSEATLQLGQMQPVEAQLLPFRSHATYILGDIDFNLPAPWFIYGFLGAGIVICAVTFSGAVAAETHSACCLSFYQFGIAFMLMVQIILAAYLFFDRSWDRELPDDPTGQLRKLKKFVEDNLETLKWFGLAVLVVQVVAIGLAMILRAMHDDKPEVEDEEEAYGAREPLLQAPPVQEY